MNTDTVLLIPETPGSLCSLINICPVKNFSACKRAESLQCGLLPKKEDIAYVERALRRSTYWYLSPSKKVQFVKNMFGVNVDECEVDVRPQIVKIISARMILSRI